MHLLSLGYIMMIAGLLFSYDLLGYGMMALSTFFIGLTIKPKNKKDKWLKYLMMIHFKYAGESDK